MDPDGMTQDVNMASVGWQTGCGGISMEEPVDLSTREWTIPMAPTPEKVRRTLRPFLEIASEQLPAPRVERVRAREPMLPARDPKLVVSDMFELEKPRFSPA
jgi:hypothetical protein